MANRNLFRMEMLILKTLEKGDYYGYQLSQELKEKSNSVISINEGTMYPIMYKLEDQGFISSRKEIVKKRQTRVYYHIENDGRLHLKKLISDYENLCKAINSILYQDKNKEDTNA